MEPGTARDKPDAYITHRFGEVKSFNPTSSMPLTPNMCTNCSHWAFLVACIARVKIDTLALYEIPDMPKQGKHVRFNPGVTCALKRLERHNRGGMFRASRYYNCVRGGNLIIPIKTSCAGSTVFYCLRGRVTVSNFLHVHYVIDSRLNHFVFALDCELFAHGPSCPGTCDTAGCWC